MSSHYQNLDGRPWYREPWPWIIMGLLGSVIIASLITLGIAISNPDAMVVDDAQYRQIKGGLRAQSLDQDATAKPANQEQTPEPSATDDDG